ncbi:Nn.00g025930.m01.CDS01 [Neocucurbitaria sp. VM-36]
MAAGDHCVVSHVGEYLFVTSAGLVRGWTAGAFHRTRKVTSSKDLFTTSGSANVRNGGFIDNFIDIYVRACNTRDSSRIYPELDVLTALALVVLHPKSRIEPETGLTSMGYHPCTYPACFVAFLVGAVRWENGLVAGPAIEGVVAGRLGLNSKAPVPSSDSVREQEVALERFRLDFESHTQRRHEVSKQSTEFRGLHLQPSPVTPTYIDRRGPGFTAIREVLHNAPENIRKAQNLAEADSVVDSIVQRLTYIYLPQTTKTYPKRNPTTEKITNYVGGDAEKLRLRQASYNDKTTSLSTAVDKICTDIQELIRTRPLESIRARVRPIIITVSTQTEERTMQPLQVAAYTLTEPSGPPAPPIPISTYTQFEEPSRPTAPSLYPPAHTQIELWGPTAQSVPKSYCTQARSRRLTAEFLCPLTYTQTPPSMHSRIAQPQCLSVPPLQLYTPRSSVKLKDPTPALVSLQLYSTKTAYTGS